MECIMPKNRLTLTVASIALAGLCLGTAAMAQAPSTPASSTSPPSTSATAPTPNPSSFMTEMRAGTWRTSKLDGVDVYNSNNEKVGDINDMLLDSSGKVSAVVIGVGGFLGMGERYVAIPFEEIRFSNEPLRSARATTPPSTSAPPSATSDRGDVTGTVRSTTGDVATRGYPDHALLNMTKEQLRSAPEFKFPR